MNAHATQPAIREAVGVFFDADKLQAAIDELQSSGFDLQQIGLLAGEHTVRQALGHLYEEANASADTAEAPRVAFS